MTCEINFEQNRSTFYAGEIVSGVIEYTATEVTPVERFFLVIEGKGFCGWKSSLVNKTAEETYITYSLDIVGNDTGLSYKYN